MKDNQLSIPGGLPQNIIRYQTERGEVALSVAFVRQHFAPKATPQEAFTFIKLCQFHSLNPFLREAYIIKYKEGEHATYIIGKDAWATRAAQQPSYDGLIAGIIVQKAETLEYRASAFFLPGESIVGGWCEVRRKDRSQPTRIEVAMAEYNKKQSLWLTLPATMIRKVATVQALREAYPGLFGGLYDASEMGTGEELPVDPMIIEGTGTWIDDDTEEDADVVAPPRTVNGTSTGDPSRGSAPLAGDLPRA
jgi:phage recombination protein Bet